MKTHRIRSVVSGLLVAPVVVALGCGDPCIDDGQGQLGAQCVDTPAEGAASGGPELDGGESATDDSGDDSGDDSADGSAMDEPVLEIFYRDQDGDGFGTPEISISIDLDAPPSGYVWSSADCDDDEPRAYPGAAELDAVGACMVDRDGDGWGDEAPAFGIVPGSDCDDDSVTTHPGIAFNDNPAACMKDDDGDGYGDYDPPVGVEPGSDCADSDSQLYYCEMVWCTDLDGDGFGDPGDCIPGGDYAPSVDRVANDDDCVDGDPAIYPGAALFQPTLCTRDADGDGYGPIVPPAGADPGRDCDDASAFAFPGVSKNETGELRKGCTRDADGDGFGDHAISGPDIMPGTDCNDGSANTFPGAAELEPPTDPAVCMADEDLDGYGDAKPPPGVNPGQDCEDGDPKIFGCATGTP